MVTSSRRALYASYLRGGQLKTCILRRGWTKSAKCVGRREQRGHYLDLEVVAAALRRTRGRQLGYQRINALAELLRHPENHRGVSRAENVGSERSAARAVINGRPTRLTAGQVHKIRMSAAFLRAHRDEFEAIATKLYRELCRMYCGVRGCDGRPVVWRRELRAAPRHRGRAAPAPAPRAAAPARVRAPVCERDRPGLSAPPPLPPPPPPPPPAVSQRVVVPPPPPPTCAVMRAPFRRVSSGSSVVGGCVTVDVVRGHTGLPVSCVVWTWTWRGGPGAAQSGVFYF